MTLYDLPDPYGSHVAHVLHVGPEKPMGYVNYKDIKAADTTPEALRGELEASGLRVLELPEVASYKRSVYDKHKKSHHALNEPVRSARRGELFYAYDEKALAELLSRPKAKQVLQEHGWPEYPEDFIRRVHAEHACPKTDLYDVVSDAFGSHNHHGRTDVVADGHMAYMEEYRGQTPIAVRELSPSAISHLNGPKEIREVLEHSKVLSHDSVEHYATQVEMTQAQREGDWRDTIQRWRERDAEQRAPLTPPVPRR